MPRRCQEIDSTASRRARPGAWLRAVEWLVGAGVHRRGGATTLVVARELAGRMDYRRGLVLYDLEGTAVRCGVSVATVKRHVRVLRELGALVWRRHGSKRNLRLPGRRYAGTATVYAATIPPAYDAALGHRLDGSGYGARVCGVTEEGRERAVRAARAPERDGVDAPRRREPHSSGAHHDLRTPDTRGRKNDTTRGRASSRSPFQVARDIAVARQVRPLVAWTQREGLRRLAYALRPFIDRGLDARDIAAELHGMAPGWRPARPAAYITAVLTAERERAEAHGAAPRPEEFRRAVAEVRGPGVVVGAEGAAYGIDGLGRADVVRLRSAARTDRALVLVALENLGERDTRRLYTNRLVDDALFHAFRRARG
ncbi:cell wall protein [Streptomyces sp. NPDC057682]|uniref:cell wall protein n=1 Tax=Streptomyces sp. NPDC057682 TaxID=3346210 RepID=UPI0036D1652F